MKTLMLVGAHHDDNELMAGTIARHRKAGWRVVSVVMTDGRWTPAGVSDQNTEIRNGESRAAAALLDMEAVFLGFKEGAFEATEASTRAAAEAMRLYPPTIVVTHPPRDYHADHMATSRCVEAAVYRCANPSYEARFDPCPAPRLYYCDAWVMPFEPDVYVDVSDYADLKKAALACHRSQFPAGGSTPGDMIDVEMTRARYRGFESGFAYAEAYRFAPRPGLVRTAELLG